MVTRVSEGRFLEVLEPSALVNLPIELDVYDGGNPGTMLATLEAAWDAAFQVEMSEVGSGKFLLSRSDPKATASILAKGNLVKVKTGGVYRGSWWIEEPVEVLTSTREAAGENWQVKGRGALAYIERAVVYPPVWPTQPAAFRSASHSANVQDGATTISCGRPSGLVNGDTMVAAVAFVGGSSKDISPPPGWKEVRRINEGTAIGVAVFVKQAGSGEPSTYQWAFGNTTQAVANIVALYNASPDYTTYAFTSTSEPTGDTITHPSLDIGIVDGALLTFAISTAGTGMTPPAGYTEATDDAQRTGRVMESAYRLGPPLGETGDVTTTNTASGSWIGLHFYVPSTATNDAAFLGETFGGVLSTLIDRAQARGGLTDLTYDFTATVDSQGNPWPDTFDLTFHAGTSLLDVWRHLVSLGLEGSMSHDLKLSAFVDMSRDRTGDVILRKGSHFLGDVANTGHYAGLRTRFLVEGAGGRIIEVVGTLEGVPTIGRREGFLSMATSDAATDLSRAGTQALEIAALEDEARSLPVDHGLVTDGQYEPWEDYRLGDYIGLDPAGTGEWASERVVGITIAHRDSLDYSVVLDLNSVSLEAAVRMRRQLDALAKSSGGGTASLALGSGGAPGGGSGSSGLVQATAGDTPGYLVDKIEVTDKLLKTLGGVSGVRTVRLDVDVPGLGTGTPDGTKFLRDDGVWSAVSGSGSPWPLDNGRPFSSTYGDHFTGASLDPKWTRRNYTAGAEEFQQGSFGSILRLNPAGRAVGDGYFQSVSLSGGQVLSVVGKVTPRAWGTGIFGFGLVVIDASGNGVGIVEYSSTPQSFLLINFNTYTSYQSQYVQPGSTAINQNVRQFNTQPPWDTPRWMQITGSGSSWQMFVSLDGVDWSPISSVLTKAMTVNRIGWMHVPLSTAAPNAHSRLDLDWFDASII